MFARTLKWQKKDASHVFRWANVKSIKLFSSSAHFACQLFGSLHNSASASGKPNKMEVTGEKHFHSLRDAAAANGPSHSTDDISLAGRLACHNTEFSRRGPPLCLFSSTHQYSKENSRLFLFHSYYFISSDLSGNSYKLVDFLWRRTWRNPIRILPYRFETVFCPFLRLVHKTLCWFAHAQ